MKTHRFSNSNRVRQDILNRLYHPYESWEEIPQALRIQILELIDQAIQKTLQEAV